MASISRLSGGRRMIQFFDPDGNRKTVYLGKMSQRQAAAVKVRVEALATAAITRHGVDDDTARWVAELDQRMNEKLAAAGLIPKRAVVMLGEFLDNYMAMRADVKESTATIFGHTKRCLLEYFGADKPLREINCGDAEAWRIWLGTDQKLADNTIRRRCGLARQFFRHAVQRKLAPENPFGGLRDVGVRGNKAREFFVTEEMAQAVLAGCPDTEWKLLFALARYGGLRTPSESLALRWGDIDRERDMIRVTSVKTAHHSGHGERWIPIFAELRPFIQAAYDDAAEGAEYVITRSRDPKVNLRKRLTDIIRKAGLTPWPKLWQNLRATRETELADRFPIQAVCEWIGNSQAVAKSHYLQVTAEHVRQAVTGPIEALQNAQHKAQQKASASAGNDSQLAARTADIAEKNAVFPSFGDECTDIQVGAAGLEPATSTL